MRKRSIDPAFFRHRALYEAEMSSHLPLRLVYIGLWCVADREGRFRWRPWELRLDIMPYEEDAACEVALVALATHGFIRRYVVDGEAFGDIPQFTKHQHPHPKEAPSRYPGCPSNVKQRQGSTLSRPRRVKDMASKADVQAFGCSGPSDTQALPLRGESEFETLWKAYPHPPGDSKAGAQHQYLARLREGVSPEAIAAGIQHYARFVRQAGNEPRYWKQCQTFLSKTGRHWESDYTVSATPNRPAEIQAPYHRKFRPPPDPAGPDPSADDPRVLALVQSVGRAP